MRRRWPLSLAILSMVLLVTSGAAHTTAGHDAPTKKWTVARTAWGHPELTGIYTNNDESLIPFERPAAFAGRQIADLTPGQIEEIDRQRNARVDDFSSTFGTTLFLGSIARKSSRPWLVVDPPDGRVPALTPEAQERLRHPTRGRSSNVIPDGPFDGHEDLGLYDRCITRGIPDSMLPVGYGANYEIIQSTDRVAIRYEMVHEVRVIPLDGRPHVGRNLHLDLGDARGWWDGDSLVVETTNFSSRSAFRGATDNLRLTERFTPATQGVLEWRVTVDDARTWTRPWSFALTLTKKDDSERIYEYACHEGNYSLRNILTGARSADETHQR
jgi:hypothetical protein